MTTSNESKGVPAHSDPEACKRVFAHVARSLGLDEGTDSSTVLARFLESKAQNEELATTVMAATGTTTMPAALEEVKALKAKAERNRLLAKSFEETTYAEKRWLMNNEPVLFNALLEQHRAKKGVPIAPASSVRHITSATRGTAAAKAAAREAYLRNPNPQTREAAFGPPEPKGAA